MSYTDHLSELEALRSQVADLSRALAERDQLMDVERRHHEGEIRDLREQSELLRSIVEGTATEAGNDCFASLVTHLTSTLQVQYAVIGEVSDGLPKKIRTVAVSAGGTLVDNFEYDLAHTPCAIALAQTFACFSRDVQAMFPLFSCLADLGAESYCAVSLRAKDGSTIGLLVVMDTKPLENSDYLRSLLEVFAPRIAAEFERKQAERERAQALADLHAVIEAIPDIVFAFDTQGNMMKWNRRVVDVTGYSPEELLNKPALAFVPPEEHDNTAAAIQRAFTEGYAELEGHLLTKDRRLIPYHWTGALLKNLHGEPIGITGVGRDVFDRKRAEEALRVSEERFALAVEGSSDILWDAHRLPDEPLYAPQTSIWWSPRVRNVLGLQESDSFETFEQWAARLHPEDKDRVFGQLTAHIEHRVPYDAEYRLRTNAGDYRWIRGRGQALWDEQGEPSRMSGSCQDITERKGVEEALRASEERWQLAVRGSNDGIWDWDIQSDTVFFSPRWKAMRGFGEHEIASHVEEWQRRIHPDDLGRVFQSLDAYMAKQTPEFCEEYRTQRKDGSYMWILDRGVALWAEDGTPLRMVGSESDITERKQAEDALRKSEAQFRALAESTTDWMWEIDEQGRYTYCSPKIRDILGYEPNDALGKTPFDFMPEEEARRVVGLFGPIAAARKPFAGIENTNRHKDGRLVVLECRGTPIIDADGVFKGYRGFDQDITDRKQAEEERQKHEVLIALMLNTGPACIKRVAADGSLLHMNPTGLKLVEACGELEVVGRSVFGLITPDHRDAFIAMHRSVIEGHKCMLQFEIQGLKGTRRWMESHAVPFWNPVTGQTEQLAVTHDITERRQAEEALRKSEAQFRALAESTTDWMWEIDEQGRYTYCSPKIRDILGYEPNDALGKTPFDFMPEEEARRVVGLFGPIAAARKPFAGIENTNRHKDGRLVILECRGTPVIDDNGLFRGYRGFDQDITERKRVEASLLQSWLFLQSFVEHTPAAVAMLDRDLRYVVVSKRWYQDYQLSEPSIIGLHHYDVFPEIREMEHWQAIHRRCLAGEILRSNEDHFPRKDGKEDWLRWEIRPWMDANGSIGGIIIFTEVITDRKQAEEALRASEERLRLSLEAANQGIYDLNVQTGEALVSSGYVTMLDHDPATFRETNAAWIERMHPDDRERVADYYGAYVAGEIPEYRVEFRQRTRGGDWRWILSLGRIVERDARGEPLRMLGTHTDITERKRVEEALRVSEERFTLAVRGSNTGIWDWDLRTGKTYFSPLWKSMLGYEEQELRGELFEWEERLHPDDRKRSSATVRAYLEGATAQYELEHRLRHKDGSYRWIMARGVSICDTEGKPYRMAGSHIDITEQKQTQEALVRSERQLRTVLDALPVGVWFTDRAGKPLLANPAAKQIWSNIKQIGLQTENPQAGWWENIGPVNEPHRWALSHVLTTGAPSLNETLDLECSDGTTKTIRNSTVPIHDMAGHIQGAIVLNEDITLLRRAQEALKLTQFSIDHAVEGFFWIGPDARILSVNDAACRMLEYGREELTAMTVHDIDPKFPPEVWPAHWEELKQSGSMTFESKQWSRTGRVLETEVTLNYLQYEGKEYNCTIMRDIGERKRIEEAVRVSEQAIRTLYEAIATPALSFDQRIQAVLEVGCRRFRLPIGVLTQIVGEDLTLTPVWAPGTSFTAGMAAPLCTTYCDAAVQSVDPVCVEHAGSSEWRNHPGYKALGLECYIGTKLIGLEHIYGTLCFMGQDPYPTTFSQADTNFLQLMARWITGELDRRKSEQALIQSEERYRSLYDETPTMYFTLAVDGTVRSVNRFGAEQLGYQVEELIGHSVLGLFRNADKEAVAASLSECLATPEVTRYWELRKLRKDGSMIWVREAARVGRSATEEAVVLVTCEDITARKQAEDALRVSEERLTLATRGSNTGVWDWDLETNEVYFSPIWKSMLGYEEHELRGEFSEWDERIHPDDRARGLATVRAYLDGTMPHYELEHRLRHKNGSYRWILARGVTLSDARGIPYRMAGSHIDITERKRMEETLRQRERSLRAAIEERELISQDLHDGILQSLFAVGLALESAKLTMPPRNHKMSRASLNQAIDQLNDVMREIRNFIAGMGSDLLKGKDLPAALKQMLASLTEHQATRVRLAVEDRAAKALSTEQSLHLIRVIQEAVSNCVKHGHAQEARVSLKMLKRGLRLRVRDNGRGFNQGAAKMTGHGLANMAARARQIGGRFTILSKVNEGTSIVLDFPKEAADVSR